jgi:hypothetical protein
VCEVVVRGGWDCGCCRPKKLQVPQFDNDNQKDPVKLGSFKNSRLFTAKTRISSSHTVATTFELLNPGQFDQQSQDVLTCPSKVDS